MTSPIVERLREHREAFGIHYEPREGPPADDQPPDATAL